MRELTGKERYDICTKLGEFVNTNKVNVRQLAKVIDCTTQSINNYVVYKNLPTGRAYARLVDFLDKPLEEQLSLCASQFTLKNASKQSDVDFVTRQEFEDLKARFEQLVANLESSHEQSKMS